MCTMIIFSPHLVLLYFLPHASHQLRLKHKMSILICTPTSSSFCLRPKDLEENNSILKKKETDQGHALFSNRIKRKADTEVGQRLTALCTQCNIGAGERLRLTQTDWRWCARWGNVEDVFEQQDEGGSWQLLDTQEVLRELKKCVHDFTHIYQSDAFQEEPCANMNSWLHWTHSHILGSRVMRWQRGDPFLHDCHHNRSYTQ